MTDTRVGSVIAHRTEPSFLSHAFPHDILVELCRKSQQCQFEQMGLIPWSEVARARQAF